MDTADFAGGLLGAKRIVERSMMRKSAEKLIVCDANRKLVSHEHFETLINVNSTGPFFQAQASNQMDRFSEPPWSTSSPDIDLRS